MAHFLAVLICLQNFHYEKRAKNEKVVFVQGRDKIVGYNVLQFMKKQKQSALNFI